MLFLKRGNESHSQLSILIVSKIELCPLTASALNDSTQNMVLNGQFVLIIPSCEFLARKLQKIIYIFQIIAIRNLSIVYRQVSTDYYKKCTNTSLEIL